jgi:hypothetical protein
MKLIVICSVHFWALPNFVAFPFGENLVFGPNQISVLIASVQILHVRPNKCTKVTVTNAESSAEAEIENDRK